MSPMYTRRQVLLIKPEYTEGTDPTPTATNITGTSQVGGSTTTIKLAAGSSAVNDYYNHMIIDITTAANTHNLREITDYVGSSLIATIAPALAAAPDSVAYTILSSAILIRDLNFTPNPLTETRDYLRDTWSPLADLITPQTSTVTFSTELKGYSLVAGQSFDTTSTTGSFPFLPEIHAAMLGCKMVVTNAGTTSRTVTYAPVTADTNAVTVTLYAYKDGVLHKVTGASGNITNMTWTAGMIAKIDFEFRGIFNSATTTALPTTNTLSVVPPACKSAGLYVGGVGTYVVQEITATLGNTLADRPDINQSSAIKGVRVSGRVPTGTFNPESVTTVADFWNVWEAGTAAALTALIGSTTHNKIGLNFANIQYTNVGYGDRDGIMTHDIPFKCTGSTDDEFKIYGQS